MIRQYSPQRSRLRLVVSNLNGVEQRSSVDRDTIIRTLLDLDLHVQVKLNRRLAASDGYTLQCRICVRRQRRGGGAVDADAAAILRPGRDANIEREGVGGRDIVSQCRAEGIKGVDRY